MDWVIGFLASSCIAGLAYWKKSLSGTGTIAAIVLGTLFYISGNLAWFGTLIAFFISSSLLSKWKKRVKQAAESVYHKGGRRDAGQVAANGGIALLLCVIHVWYPNSIVWDAFLGVMATVNADTWATEIGGLSKNDPIFILNGSRVPKGTSGGISGLGLAATTMGALFIGFVAWLFAIIVNSPEFGGPVGGTPVSFFVSCILTAGVAGVLGSLLDSFFGASIQTMYRCTVCGKEVERIVHCDSPTIWIRGWRMMNNDMVNVSSSVLGGIAGAIIGASIGASIGVWLH